MTHFSVALASLLGLEPISPMCTCIAKAQRAHCELWDSQRKSALTGTDPTGEDPGPGGHGSLDQAFPKDLFQLGLHLKVLDASVHGY